MKPPSSDPPAKEVPTVSRKALLDACGLPGWSLFINFVSLGILLKTAGFNIFHSLLTTLLIYALPGQIALVDGMTADISLPAIALLVLFINARLLPMAMATATILTRSQHSTIGYYLSAHFVAVTGWLNFMNRYHQVGLEKAYAYFVYSNLALWGFALAGTVVGFYIADHMPIPLLASLLLLNPLYFLCLIAESGTKDTPITIAILAGALLYLPLDQLIPGWGLLLAGLMGGGFAALFFHKHRAATKE